VTATARMLVQAQNRPYVIKGKTPACHGQPPSTQNMVVPPASLGELVGNGV